MVKVKRTFRTGALILLGAGGLLSTSCKKEFGDEALAENSFSKELAGGKNLLAADSLGVPSDSVAASSTAKTILQDKVVEIAVNLLGQVEYAHTYDPDSLKFDCSGYTYYVFKQAGIDLKTRDDDKQALLGKYVSRANLQKGDLVFFRNPDAADPYDVTHVGIYIGEGRFIHNANSKYDVVISKLFTSWRTPTYLTARRVI